MHKKRTILIAVIAVVFAVVFIVSGWHVISYMRSASQNSEALEEARGYAQPAPQETSADAVTDSPSVTNSGAAGGNKDRLPIQVDFSGLQALNPDIAAWLYCEGTGFNHPVMYSGDNSFYLDHATDRTYNSAGSLFIDCLCAPDFSDEITVIYGHNMLNKSMFGKLPNYAKVSYYEKAQVMYLLTPTANYELELLARGLADENSALYTVGDVHRSAEEYSEIFPAETRFREDMEFRDGDRYVLLSTCTYEYNGARFVVLGRLNELP
jgi:sortase B